MPYSMGCPAQVFDPQCWSHWSVHCCDQRILGERHEELNRGRRALPAGRAVTLAPLARHATYCNRPLSFKSRIGASSCAEAERGERQCIHRRDRFQRRRQVLE